MNMLRRFLREVAAAGLPAGPGPADVVGDDQIIFLPEPAQRYLRFMGVVGRHRDWSFRLGFRGRFRTKPEQTCDVNGTYARSWPHRSGEKG